MSLLDNVLGYGAAYTCGVHNSLQSVSKSATYHRDAYIRHILHILAPIRMHKSVILSGFVCDAHFFYEHVLRKL
jgi:hypothetical protein